MFICIKGSTVKIIEGKNVVFFSLHRSCKFRHFISKTAKQTQRKRLLIITSWCLKMSQLLIETVSSGLLKKNLLEELYSADNCNPSVEMLLYSGLGNLYFNLFLLNYMIFI